MGWGGITREDEGGDGEDIGDEGGESGDKEGEEMVGEDAAGSVTRGGGVGI